MNKPLATVELSLATPPVTKRQRLQRFANVIRSDPRVPLHLFINLEYRDAGEWKYLAHPGSAFALAAKDSVLHDAGLTGDSVGDAQRFFDLSREELAEFSGVCGGSMLSKKSQTALRLISRRKTKHADDCSSTNPQAGY
jgi:hypothetical protein